MDVLSRVQWAGLIGVAASLLLLTATSRIIYNLFFHPLRRFPGPTLWRATRLPYANRLVRKTLTTDMLALFIKYGPVVRIAPDELAFADPDAWRDIYGHRTGDLRNAEEMPKSPAFYGGLANSNHPSIIGETKERHSVLRRQLAHGFSDKSLRGQESIIGGYVDLLVEQLKKHCVEATGDGAVKPNSLDMVSWYNWTTFDVIGDLAFGESFGCLKNAEYHPWVVAVNEAVRTNGEPIALNLLGLGGLMRTYQQYAMPSRKAHMSKTMDMLLRRMKLDVERPDLIEGLLRKRDDWQLDIGHLHANASTLIVAGSETTASLLSGATYLLLKNPDKLDKLIREVRTSFQSDDEITLLSVGKLTYMLACLDEAMRCYPPAPFGLPRVTPKGGAVVAGRQIPENTTVAVWQWATYHSPALFKDPFGYHPERWLHDPNYESDRLDAMNPFSIGPRNCIGRNLAYSEMRLILARLLFNFDIRLVDDQNDWLDQEVGTLWSKKPLNVHLTPVKGDSARA